MKTYRHVFLATLAALSCAVPALAAGANMPEKVDKALAGTLASGAATQKVIITVAPGYRDTLRRSLIKHGDRIKAEFPSLNVLVTELHTSDVLELAKNGNVKALSLDGPVRAHQDGLSLSLTDGTELLNSTWGSLTGALTSTTSTLPILTTTLRQTLGLPAVATSSTLTGSTGIGVALIDSGIAPSADFNGRIVNFYVKLKL